MDERNPADRPLDDEDDDVVGHRFLTPEQAEERAQRARSERDAEDLSGDR